MDAGKSTLMGHLLYLLGNVNKRTMHKYEQESKKAGKASFAYAWVLDETGEERDRYVLSVKLQTKHAWTGKFSVTPPSTSGAEVRCGHLRSADAYQIAVSSCCLLWLITNKS